MRPHEHHSIYRGITINRVEGSGYYTAFILGVGNRMADTLAGIRELIRDALLDEKGNGK